MHRRFGWSFERTAFIYVSHCRTNRRMDERTDGTTTTFRETLHIRVASSRIKGPDNRTNDGSEAEVLVNSLLLTIGIEAAIDGGSEAFVLLFAPRDSGSTATHSAARLAWDGEKARGKARGKAGKRRRSFQTTEQQKRRDIKQTAARERQCPSRVA